MKEILKKFWFVIIIAALLIAMSVGFIIVEMNKVTPMKKTSDGKDVVFEYAGVDVTADSLYDEIYAVDGFRQVITLYENQLYSKALEPDQDMISQATLNKEQTLKNAKSQYGEEYKKVLQKMLLPYGYANGVDDLYNYFLTLSIRQKVVMNYIDEHKDLWEAYKADKNPRVISHILIKMDDSKKPTEEELKRVDAVKEALAKEDADFGLIAKSMSEDEGSATNNGKLGMTDKDNVAGFVGEFHEAAYSVGVGEMTDWFVSSYGYHIIKVDSDSYEDIKETENFLKNYTTYYPNLEKLITIAEASKQNITISGNEEFEAKFKEYYNVTEAK